MTAPRIEPPDVVRAVNEYVDSELADARNYSNRQPLDESGVWSLHALAARIYAQGWQDGERAEDARVSARHIRERQAQTASEAT